MLGVTTDEYLMKITDSVAEGGTAKCISLIDELIINGKDVYQFIKDLTLHFRNLLICSVNTESFNILNVSEEIFEEFKMQAKKFSTEGLLRNINILSGAETDAKWVSQPRIILEMAVIRMCKKELGTDIDSVLERVANLERALSRGIPAAAQENRKREDAAPARRIPGQDSNKQEAAVPRTKGEVQQEQTEQFSDIPLQDILKKWKDILKAINTGGYKTLYAFLLEGKPVGMMNGVLNIGFEKKYEFHKGRVEEESNRKIAEDYVASVCGSRVRIKCSIIDEIAADKQEDGLVEKTRSIFGRDIVEVEE
jgi:DNA polymerase-3 subunit gamma/tau